MAKLIFIRTDYQTGIVLPISLLEHLPNIQVVKTAGYSEVKDITPSSEFGKEFTFIDSYQIGKKEKDERHLKELQEDMAAIQAQIDEAHK